MTEAQIQLQNALTTTFLANLAFLSEYDNELYHRIDELSRMIEQGTYKEKYALEFNMQDGDFDIYDIVNDKYLYNKKPKKFNSDLVRKVEFDNKFSILNLPTYFIFKQKNEGVDLEDRFNLKTRFELANLTLNDTLEYSNYLKAYQGNKKKRIKKIDKFIFLGTLLGRHIPKIAEKIDAQMYLVVERNLEIIGEAVNRISKKDENLEITDKRKIISVRNRIIHGYDQVSDELIWSIITQYLPVLEKEVRQYLNE